MDGSGAASGAPSAPAMAAAAARHAAPPGAPPPAAVAARPKAFDKMEALVREMQDNEQGGVPVRSQKLFLTCIPAAFMGYDLIEWLMMRLEIEESEALNLANQLCQYGYFFPISDSKNLVVKDDSSLYRFQSPQYWPWRGKPPDNVDYAIYLAKRTLRNKQRHALEDYELEAMGNLRRNLANKWDLISAQAEEQVRLAKSMKKADKLVADSQEKAYWRVHRPPPGVPSAVEPAPVPARNRPRRRTLTDWSREVEQLRNSVYRTRVKVSQALEALLTHAAAYAEYDPMLVAPHPSNPWVAEDTTYWQLNGPLVEVPTEKRVKRWALSMEDLIMDPTGVQEFTNYLRKEKSEENILFWLAVNDLRRSAQSQIIWKIQEIYNEYVRLGSPGEVNIDNQTMDRVLDGMRNNSRYCFDAAQEHVYNLLLKKDCYPRFIRSEYYKGLLANGVQPSQKKRFFGFGPAKKKSSTSTTPTTSQLLQQVGGGSASSACGAAGPSSSTPAAALARRRGSDRSLSGSAHELAAVGVRGTTGVGTGSGVDVSRVPHSHSQSNLSDVPYRVKKTGGGASVPTSEEVCPWETASSPIGARRSRRDSAHLDSGSSSSDVSVTIADISEKVQKTCILMQQHTVDDASGKKLSASYEAPRRASVSVPITHPSSDNAKRKVSSFEETNTSQASTSSSGLDRDRELEKKDVENTPMQLVKTLKKSHSIAKTSAPIISVSSAADDVPTDIRNEEEQQVEMVAGTPPTASQSESVLAEPSENQEVSLTAAPSLSLALPLEPLAPLAEPDGESPASEPPTEVEAELGAIGGRLEEEGVSEVAATAADGEAKASEVCPWEDEETCKVDTPFVKTYATLGYL